MNRVLERATQLLACLGRHPDGVALRALASESGVPASTCVRLLRDLVALGWADQSGPRGGYRIGPRAASLAHEQPYRGRLVEIVRPAAARLASRLRAQVIVAVMRGMRRLVVLRVEGDQAPFLLEEERELYASASGRLLVATLSWRARRRLIDRIGLPPSGSWPGVSTAVELAAECAAIRRAGWVLNRPSGGDRHAVAVPLPDGEGGMAALALGMSKRGWSDAAALREARALARRLAPRLAGG